MQPLSCVWRVSWLISVCAVLRFFAAGFRFRVHGLAGPFLLWRAWAVCRIGAARKGESSGCGGGSGPPVGRALVKGGRVGYGSQHETAFVG